MKHLQCIFYLLSQHRPALASLPPRMSHRRAPAWRRETLDPQQGRSCSRKLKNPHRPLWRVPRLAKLQAFWWINMREIRALGKIRNLFDMNFSCSFCSAAIWRGAKHSISVMEPKAVGRSRVYGESQSEKRIQAASDGRTREREILSNHTRTYENKFQLSRRMNSKNLTRLLSTATFCHWNSRFHLPTISRYTTRSTAERLFQQWKALLHCLLCKLKNNIFQWNFREDSYDARSMSASLEELASESREQRENTIQ